jgi:hypothetical protein
LPVALPSREADPYDHEGTPTFCVFYKIAPHLKSAHQPILLHLQYPDSINLAMHLTKNVVSAIHSFLGVGPFLWYGQWKSHGGNLYRECVVALEDNNIWSNTLELLITWVFDHNFLQWVFTITATGFVSFQGFKIHYNQTFPFFLIIDYEVGCCCVK